MHVHSRWVDSEGNSKFETFILEVKRSTCWHYDTAAHPLPGVPKRKQQLRRATDKGAMHHEFSREVWEWLTHISSVHWNNSPVQINGKTVKACNPLGRSARIVLPRRSVWYVHFNTTHRSRILSSFSTQHLSCVCVWPIISNHG